MKSHEISVKKLKKRKNWLRFIMSILIMWFQIISDPNRLPAGPKPRRMYYSPIGDGTVAADGIELKRHIFWLFNATFWLFLVFFFRV